MTAVIDRIRRDRAVFSVEFFPPRDDVGELALWRAVRELEPTGLAFDARRAGPAGSAARARRARGSTGPALTR